MQLYIKNADSKYAVNNPILCGFKRVSVKAGEIADITMQIDGRAFTVVNDAGERILDGKHFEVYAGTSQPDARSIELTGIAPIKLELNI